MRLSTFLVALVSLSASPALAQERPVLRALNGESPGVRVSGAGSSTGFTIRCGSSIKSSNQPLLVVDGVVARPGTESSLFSALEPGDVVSVEVYRAGDVPLRFGVGAQNGVVEITTRNAPPRPAPAAAYPNPATVGTEVSLNVGASGPVRVEVFDVLGRSALAFDAEADALTLPTAGLARGAYVVRVSGAGGAEVRRVTVR